jgi:hypothetical protein
MLKVEDVSHFERCSFQVVCESCGSLSIKLENPERAPANAQIRCSGCGAVRGTLANLRDLARRGNGQFEF